MREKNSEKERESLTCEGTKTRRKIHKKTTGVSEKKAVFVWQQIQYPEQLIY